MKILILTKWLLRWVGSSKVAYALSLRLARKNEVLVAAYRDKIDSMWKETLNIYEIKNIGPAAINEIRRLCRVFKPDITHSHGLLGLGSIFSGVPTVTTTHSNWPSSWFLSSTYFLAGLLQDIPQDLEMRLSSNVVSVSRYSQRSLLRRGIKSFVIYNGVERELLDSTPSKLSLQHPCILFVGSLDNRKARFLVQALRLLNELVEQDIHNYIVGKIVDRKIARALQKIPNTRCLGVVPNVIPYYHEADVLLFPSVAEACPLVPLEAQACGLPVVAFDVCSHSEIIQNGKTGLLASRNDLSSLVENLVRILTDDALRNRLSMEGQTYIKRVFMWDDQVKKYADLFESITRDAKQ